MLVFVEWLVWIDSLASIDRLAINYTKTTVESLIRFAEEHCKILLLCGNCRRYRFGEEGATFYSPMGDSAIGDALLEALSDLSGFRLAFAQRVLLDNPSRSMLTSSSVHEVLDELQEKGFSDMKDSAIIERAISTSQAQRYCFPVLFAILGLPCSGDGRGDERARYTHPLCFCISGRLS